MDDKLKDDRWCFACGTHNPHGLKLTDIHIEDDECVCSFVPQKHHQGWVEILHGGITATLLDEVMTHLLYRLGYDAVTAEMSMRLKRPIPIGQPLQARAKLTRFRRRFAETEGVIVLGDGEIGATATAKFMTEKRTRDTLGGPILTLAERDAVIFDLFGTLVPVFSREGYFDCLAEMADVLAIDSDSFTEMFRADATARTTGEWPDLEGNVADIVRRAGLSVSPDALRKAVEVRTEFTRRHLMAPHGDAMMTLEALRSEGRKIGVVSDCSPETPPLWDQSPLAEYIPDPVLSCAVGARKPDPRIYHMALERMGVDPANAIYVGDGDSNELTGAREIGLCPVLIDRGEDSAFRTYRCDHCEIVIHDMTRILPLIGIGELVHAQ